MRRSRTCALLIAAALAACETTVHSPAATGAAATATAPVASAGQGAIVMRLLPNNDGTDPYLKAWGKVRLQREGDAAPYSIAPLLDAASRSAVFAGALPPGRYRFMQLPSFACGYVCTPSVTTPASGFASFEVEADHLTDLGAIALTTTPGSNVALLATESRPSGPATAELVREIVPGFAPLLARPVRHWGSAAALPATGGTGPVTSAQAAAADPKAPMAPAPHEALAALLGEVAWRSSKGFSAPVETAEAGTFIHGSALGVVYSRTGAGARRAHNLAERAAVDAVLVAADGRWIAGGEYSLLKQSRDRGTSWETVRGNLPFGLVVALAESRGQVLAAVLRDRELRLFAADAATLGPQTAWRLLYAATLDLAAYWTATRRPELFVQGERVVLTLPNRQVAVIDLAGGTAQTLVLPGAIQHFAFGADGVMRCRCASTNVNPFESHDLGRTWRAVDTSRYWMLPAWQDARNGVMLRNAFAGASKLAVTRDGGASWVESATAVPHDLHHLRWSKDGKTLYAASLQGEFWVSRDEGRNWQPTAPVR